MVRLISKIIFNCVAFQTKDLAKKTIVPNKKWPEGKELRKRNNQLRFAGLIIHGENQACKSYIEGPLILFPLDKNKLMKFKLFLKDLLFKIYF